MKKVRLIREVVQQGASSLQQAGLDGAAREARLLMGLCLGWTNERVWRDETLPMPQERVHDFCQLVARRSRHESYARLAGKREFWSLEFAVNPFVLEPRPDSEALVRAALRHARGRNFKINNFIKIRNFKEHDFIKVGNFKKGNNFKMKNFKDEGGVLDLGTGSGCLLAAFLHERPDAHGIGIDRCWRACRTARSNWYRLGLHRRAHVLCCDWTDAVLSRFSLIMCNPPYVKSQTIGTLPFADYEPKGALDGGHDGLAAYRCLVPKMRDVLTFDGRLVIEVGDDSLNDVTTLLRQSGLHEIDREHDLSGATRALVACIKR